MTFMANTGPVLTNSTEHTKPRAYSYIVGLYLH